MASQWATHPHLICSVLLFSIGILIVQQLVSLTRQSRTFVCMQCSVDFVSGTLSMYVPLGNHYIYRPQIPDSAVKQVPATKDVRQLMKLSAHEVVTHKVGLRNQGYAERCVHASLDMLRELNEVLGAGPTKVDEGQTVPTR